MDLELSDKYALVTGGTRGIGLAIGKTLAGEGCGIAICSRTKDNVMKGWWDVLKASKAGTSTIGVELDATSDSLEDEVGKIVNTFGKLDILINNVGGGGRWGKDSIEDTSIDTWDDVYRKNATAAARFTKAVIPHMRKNKWGRVVTISSIYGKEAGGRPWFNMAKSAEISLMKSLSKRMELVRDGITFNTVCPGHISVEGKPDETNLETFPLGRMGTTQEVANVVAFLCSPKASLVNGACITVDGGESFSF